MFLIDGDDLYECDESDCDEEADGSGCWVPEGDGSETFYEYCELDLEEYDLG
jgi:hypothetical protein